MTTLTFTQEDIKALEQRYRATFINSLGGFKSLVLVGTKNKTGTTNLAPFSSFFHIGANPPLFGLIVRPGTDQRHTFSNILQAGVFTINHVHESFYVKAHQCSARFKADQSEFDATGLSEEYLAGFAAPFVKESRIKLGARLCEKIDIPLNGTTLLLSEIVQVILPSPSLMHDGFVDTELAGTVTCSGLDSYHTTKRLARLSYAKPDKWPEQLSLF